ncbi:uncharacterized protein LOC129596455 [Paramacrobiotus metropolitanus]|uniref:uncharacterized protein LOC129596455 n=1 Tax=Paramacrobiotus metropolitanus TaxID=2943436 RepID=UPI0024465C6E|nr:uncharacterized protein LOC129596455 [Paramacrobiotus metropolitanus]
MYCKPSKRLNPQHRKNKYQQTAFKAGQVEANKKRRDAFYRNNPQFAPKADLTAPALPTNPGDGITAPPRRTANNSGNGQPVSNQHASADAATAEPVTEPSNTAPRPRMRRNAKSAPAAEFSPRVTRGRAAIQQPAAAVLNPGPVPPVPSVREKASARNPRASPHRPIARTGALPRGDVEGQRAVAPPPALSAAASTAAPRPPGTRKRNAAAQPAKKVPVVPADPQDPQQEPRTLHDTPRPPSPRRTRLQERRNQEPVSLPIRKAVKECGVASTTQVSAKPNRVSGKENQRHKRADQEQPTGIETSSLPVDRVDPAKVSRRAGREPGLVGDVAKVVPAVQNSAEDRVLAQARRSPRPTVGTELNEEAQHDLLRMCAPAYVVNTGELFSDMNVKRLRKVSEGSYSDVFSGRRGNETLILKIVPVDGVFVREEKHENQLQTADLLAEVQISFKLSADLLSPRGTHFAPIFIRTHFVTLAQGPYPKECRRPYKNFASLYPDRAINQDPETYPRDQQYVVIALEKGGVDLEGFEFDSIRQILSVFRQLVIGIAIAEDKMQLEHRDLHLSNILVNKTSKIFVDFKSEGNRYRIPTDGVQVRVIDWTISRLNDGEKIFFKDLSTDPAIFEGEEGHAQSEVYRKMRTATGEDWMGFHPSTNKIWLEYIHQVLVVLSDGEKVSAAKEQPDRTAQKQLIGVTPLWPTVTSAADLVTKAAKVFKEVTVIR